MRWVLLSLCLCAFWAFADSEQIFVASDEQQITQVELFEFSSPQLQQQAINLAKSLRCPQCQNQNLVESNSPIALDLRLVVFEMINQGKSEQQVVDYMTARYGDFVLYKPPFSLQNSMLWGLPVLALLLFVLRSAMGVVGRKNNA
ncbi:heme lyase NrfEFG subunit NrfF [Vibrio fluminensis]|uniref:heme lyase NrfEFG subunit NrfF n=1 Tax=Vibrio fluminensis TaxID=2783614 RepID=UPI0018871ACC|nr:heme lyase NrfEFG subunit NrfF [Vibrio fluminensis]